MRDATIEKLRKTLPPLLTVKQYCALMGRCEASAYHDLRSKAGIGVKVGGSTRFLTDAVLDELRHLPAWTPQKDRASKAKVNALKRSVPPRGGGNKQTSAPRRERDREVRP